MLLGFVSRVIVVRYLTQNEYGIFSLALVLMSIFVTISTPGLQEGATRYIAYFMKIFSAAVPFTVLIGIFASIFRGFDRVEPKAYFQNILRQNSRWKP